MLDLWRLKRDRQKVVRGYQKRLRKLQREKATADDLEELRQSEWAELQGHDDELNRFLSDQLWEEAREHDIAIPTGDGVWEESIFRDRKYLSMDTRAKLRRLIDEEKARRFEVKTLWVTKIVLPLAGVLVGVIGALTGLVAVLEHKK